MLFDYPSIVAITDYTAKLLNIDPDTEPLTATPAPVDGDGLLDRLEDLSEDELDKLLAERMQAG